VPAPVEEIFGAEGPTLTGGGAPRSIPVMAAPSLGVPPALPVLIVSLLAGCAPPHCEAPATSDDCPPALIARTLSERLFCPRERITVRERRDLPLHRFACLAPEAPWLHAFSELKSRCTARPPPEVAADPERLALFRRIQDEALGAVDGLFTPVHEVTACGQHGFYACPRTQWRSVTTDHCDGSSLIDLGAQEPPAAR
jgi:hypothetical protein